jgi:hypothetical protein
MSLPTLLPFAKHELIPPGKNDPPITPIGNIFHVAVSEAPDLHDYFNGPSGGIESHGYIRRDGTVIQYRTLDREADAQFAGNSFTYNGKLCGFLSWETQGMGVGEWTPEQVATIERIIQWTHVEGGIPLGQAPAWNRPGNGYHSLFKEWNANNHSCPGPDRIRQWPSILKEVSTMGKPMTRGVNVDAAIAAIRHAIAANARHPFKRAKLRTALAALLSIRARVK